MKGFILFTGNFNESSIPKELIAPWYSKEYLCQITIGSSLSFVAWGDTPGDVYYSRNMDQSLLVLNGYILDTKFMRDFCTQQEATDSLREYFDRNHSIEYCSQIASQIYGSFSIIYANLEEQRVCCITDRISSRPIWTNKTRNGWIISSHVSPIAHSIRNIEYDLGALGAFLLYGCLVDPTKSIYKGITAIEQGSIMFFAMSGRSSKHRWYTYLHKPDKTLSYNGWLDLTSQYLKKAATRILNKSGKSMVFLSGGIDSRLTASALRSVGGEPLLVTIGDHENQEIKVTKMVASALGCHHEIIIRDPYWYLRSLPSAVYETGGSYAWFHGHFSEAYRKCQVDFGVQAALLGDFCEAFSKLLCVVPKNKKRLWTSQEFLKDFDKLPLPLYRPMHRDVTLRLLSPIVRHELTEQLHHDIVERYARVCNVSEDPRIVADYFFRWQSASTIATFFMFLDVRSAGPERSLMFDNDTHQLLEMLPASMRDGANFGGKLIQLLWPPAAKVVNSNSLLPLSLPSSAHTAAKFIKPVLGRLRRYFFDNSYRTTGSWPKRSLLYLNDQTWRNFFEKILCNRSLFDEDIFDFEAILNCWNTFCAGDLSLESDIEKLVEIGLLNLYFQSDSDSLIKYQDILNMTKV